MMMHAAGMWLIWGAFSLVMLAIVLAGSRLSHYGDVIAEKSGLGGSWVGLMLMATVTSLPELATVMSAVTVAATPDIAVGDALGACVFNLVIITVLDFLQRGESVYTRASQGHILSAGFGVILLGVVGFTLLWEQHVGLPRFGHVGMSTPIILFIYLVAVRSVFVYERHRRTAEGFMEERTYGAMTMRQALLGYGRASAVIVAAGISLPFIGERIAAGMGWEQSFVGTLFVAMATTGPELAVTIAAMRLGALDMAIGNLLGSNMFDVVIIALGDMAFVRGPLLAHVSEVHSASAMTAMMMSGVAIVGLLYRPPKRVFRTVGWVSLFLLSLFLLNFYALYLYAGTH